MRIVHELIIRPEIGLEAEAAKALEELGTIYAGSIGYVESYTLDGLAEGGLLAHLSIWESRAAANHAATLDQTLAMRERLEGLAATDARCALLDIVSERAIHAMPAVA